MPLAGRLLGLLLLPGNRLCVGEVGVFTDSAVLGRAERLRGCVPSSCGGVRGEQERDRDRQQSC